jgi:hypothetical protein
MFTYNGDSNLDGKVNSTDYALMTSGFPTVPAGYGWEYGLYDYGYFSQTSSPGVSFDEALYSTGASGYSANGKINAPDLAAPSALTLTPASTTEVDLGWTNPAGTSSAVVQVSTDGGSTWTTLTTVSSPTDTYDATGLSASSLYYFRVQVLDSSSEASPWATASGYTYYAVQATGTASLAYQNTSALFAVGNIQVEGPSPSAGQISALIDWGDDTQSAGTITASGSSFTLTGTHEYYQPGAYAVTAEVVYSPPSVSAVDTFLGSYMEVRSGVDPATSETNDSYSISSSADFALTPALSINNSTGSYSLSVVGSATYGFDQTLDQADEDGGDSVQRQETGGAIDFNFSDSGTFTVPPSSPSFSVASYSLSSAGSASLTMIDDQRAINDSLDQTLADPNAPASEQAVNKVVDAALNVGAVFDGGEGKKAADELRAEVKEIEAVERGVTIERNSPLVDGATHIMAKNGDDIALKVSGDTATATVSYLQKFQHPELLRAAVAEAKAQGAKKLIVNSGTLVTGSSRAFMDQVMSSGKTFLGQSFTKLADGTYEIDLSKLLE